jgi:D-alanyl-D-alanine dipeptidase
MTLTAVMAGLVPAIHAFALFQRRTWMPATSPGITLAKSRALSRASLLAAFTIGSTASAIAQERPSAFVDAANMVPGLIVDIRYAGSNNFVGKAIDGYEKSICYLTREAAAALAQVARDIEPRGLVLKAFDCYRPERAVRHFVRWVHNSADVARKAAFYPEVDKRNLLHEGYIAARSAHSRGSTIDLTLARIDGAELDMGTPFDFFSPRAAPSDRIVSAEARGHRALLAQAMRRRGFMAYRKEWWHFTLRDEPFRDRHFDFVVR